MAKTLLSVLIIMLGLTGCTTTDPARQARPGPALVLEDYFQGRVEAWGIFEDRFGRLRRQFKADIDAEWDGQVLTLTENFTYDDGETDQRIWRFRKTNEGYVGTAGDVIGEAQVRLAGNAATFGYTVDLKMKDSTLRVQFRDWLYQQDERVLINRASVTKFGIEIGEVTVFFVREAPVTDAATDAAPAARAAD